MKTDQNKNKISGFEKAFRFIYLDDFYQKELYYKILKNQLVSNHPFIIFFSNNFNNQNILFNIIHFFLDH